jgi:hypothetical protein
MRAALGPSLAFTDGVTGGSLIRPPTIKQGVQ